MISFSNKFIYIHVPKCGGTSVLNKIGYLTTFNKSGWGKQDHSFMSETKTHLSNQNFEEYYKFSIVRNTWNRLASLWGHNKAGGDYLYNTFCKENEIDTFEKFIHNLDFILESQKDIEEIQRSVEPLSTWLWVDGENYFDDIFNLTELDKNWETICEKTGIGKETPLGRDRQRRKSGNYWDWYTGDMKKKVEKLYGEEIEYFKFRFNE